MTCRTRYKVERVVRTKDNGAYGKAGDIEWFVVDTALNQTQEVLKTRKAARDRCKELNLALSNGEPS